MAKTYGVNFVMTADNTQAMQKINEVRSAIDSPIAPSAYGPAINPQNALQNQNNNNDEKNDASNYFANSNLLEVNKGILNELKTLSTHFIRGNGNQNIIQNSQTNQNRDNQDKKKIDDKIKSMVGTAILSGITGYIANDTGNVRIKMAELQGDYFGSQIARNNKDAGVVKGLTSLLPILGGVAGSIFAPGVGTMAGATAGAALQSGINSIAGTFTENRNVHVEEQKLLSDSYKNRLKLNDESLAMYGGDSITRNSARTNAGFEKAIANAFLGRSQNTGMELDEFQSLANQFSRYGVTDYYKAGDLARATALTQSFTGADATDFLGLQSRLGKNSTGAIDTMNNAYSASMASGLGKGQFGEFLNGLQSAVEDGISNGFIRSTDDVSKTMVMFSKLSGNDPTLMGEHGFRFLRQMDNGLKNATNLSSTTHLMAFQALRGLNTGAQGVEHINGQDALNTLAYMEGGVNNKNFATISKRFKAQYGDDILENVLAYKELFGVNYNGAMKLLGLQNKVADGGTVSEDEIKNVIANPEYNTDQKNMVNYLNDIKFNTSILGEGSFRKYLDGLAGIDQKYAKSRDVYEKVGVHTGVELREDVVAALLRLKTSGSIPALEQFTRIQAALNNPEKAEFAAQKLNEFNSYGERTQTERFLYQIAGTLSDVRDSFNNANVRVIETY